MDCVTWLDWLDFDFRIQPLSPDDICAISVGPPGDKTSIYIVQLVSLYTVTICILGQAVFDKLKGPLPAGLAPSLNTPL